MHELNFHLNVTQDIWHGVTVIFICLIIIGVAVLLDLYTGIKAAKTIKEPIRSHILRRTITKIIEYWIVVILGVLIDILGLSFIWYKIPYAAIVISLCVLIIEGRSMLENLTKAKSPASNIDDVAADILQEIVDCKSAKTAGKIIEKIKVGVNEKN